MNNPTISIIVPVYNVEKYLHQCIDSILAQTFTNFELILVVDGSPDKSGEICDRYAKLDNRIKVIYKENGGVSSARNIGLEAAKGQYIGFVDGDDFIHHEMYQTLYYHAVKNSSDIVLCDYQKIRENEAPLKKRKTENSIQHFSNLQALSQLYNNEPAKSAIWVYPWNKIYKRSLFQGLRYKNGRIYEDEFLAHILLYNSQNITYVNEILYYYFQRTDSYIGSKFSLKKFDRVYALKERVEFFKTIKQEDLYNQALKHFMDVFFWYYLKAQTDLGNINKELKMLKRTLNKSLIPLLKNPLIGWKQKIFLILFVFNPSIYKTK